MSRLVYLDASPSTAYAWENEGHRIINRLAVKDLPSDVPAFLRTEAVADEIEYLGPNRTAGVPLPNQKLYAAQAPEQLIDLEPADALGPLPHRLLDFEAEVLAAGERPERIGLQPWETTEVWERLKVAMRDYRHLAAEGKDTRPVEQAIVFYAG